MPLTIPYTLYFEDEESYSGEFTVEDGKQSVSTIPIPTTVKGTVLRVELGPVEDIDIHLIGAKAQVHKTGRDTELDWVDLNGQIS